MKNTDFEEAIELALRTWYPKDHPLHFDPHHPMGKLLGEWGELLDDYMKGVYKPGYEFNPIDELCDIWYYIRILCYQRCRIPDTKFITNGSTDYLIAKIMGIVSSSFINVTKDFPWHPHTVDHAYFVLVEIAKRYNLTIDQLTEHNWNKLKPGSERGKQWMKARVSTKYVGGKVSLR